MLHTVLPTNTQNTFKISPGHSYITLHCQNDQMYALDRT